MSRRTNRNLLKKALERYRSYIRSSQPQDKVFHHQCPNVRAAIHNTDNKGKQIKLALAWTSTKRHFSTMKLPAEIRETYNWLADHMITLCWSKKQAKNASS